MILSRGLATVKERGCYSIPHPASLDKGERGGILKRGCASLELPSFSLVLPLFQNFSPFLQGEGGLRGEVKKSFSEKATKIC
jgi:hypothetical protein